MRFSKLITLGILFVSPCLTSAQTTIPYYHVVIGAFAKLENAERLTDKANKMNLDAHYNINPAKQLYYVFILKTSNKQEAFALSSKVKAETNFKDVWVFTGALGNELTLKEATPVLEEPKEERPREELPVVIKEQEEEPIFIDSVVIKEPEEKIKPAGKPFFFKMVSSDTGNPVSGEIHILQTTNDRQYQAVVSNETVYLLPPKNKNGTFEFVTLALGYKEVKGTISYNDPAVSEEVGSKSGTVITMPLVPVKLGDYIEFSNVRFFQNTAILQPESQNELDGLMNLLKQNTKYKIRIRSHCNTYTTRDITTMGTSKDFFALNNTNEKRRLTAKEVTQLRADVVMQYLVQQGIEAQRIKTKGEGDILMYYPKGSVFAYRNDRIEVEILKGK